MAYRWKSGDRKGAWQPTQREAIRNAINAGVARRGTGGEIIWVDGAAIESGEGRRG